MTTRPDFSRVSKIKGTKSESKTPTDFLSTGIQQLDLLLSEGIPRGKIIEIVGSPSSGKTSLTFSILAQATSRGELVAYIDPSACFDPFFARKAGIDLQHLLWIRGGTRTLDKALKATDIVTRSGGFGVVVLDLESRQKAHKIVEQIPLHVWFRLQRVVEATPTILLLLGREAIAGNTSDAVLSLQRNQAQWCSAAYVLSSPTSSKHAKFLRGISSLIELYRGKHSNHNATLYCHF